MEGIAPWRETQTDHSLLPWACRALSGSFNGDNLRGRNRNMCFPSQGSKGVYSSDGKVSVQGYICLSTNYTLETAQKEVSCDFFPTDAGRQCAGKLPFLSLGEAYSSAFMWTFLSTPVPLRASGRPQSKAASPYSHHIVTGSFPLWLAAGAPSTCPLQGCCVPLQLCQWQQYYSDAAITPFW